MDTESVDTEAGHVVQKTYLPWLQYPKGVQIKYIFFNVGGKLKKGSKVSCIVMTSLPITSGL